HAARNGPRPANCPGRLDENPPSGGSSAGAARFPGPGAREGQRLRMAAGAGAAVALAALVLAGSDLVGMALLLAAILAAAVAGLLFAAGVVAPGVLFGGWLAGHGGLLCCGTGNQQSACPDGACAAHRCGVGYPHGAI